MRELIFYQENQLRKTPGSFFQRGAIIIPAFAWSPVPGEQQTIRLM